MMEYSREELKRIQDKSLEMALYFKKICDENDLMFYFCGGCCIGAVRHGGFIPGTMMWMCLCPGETMRF